MAMPQHEHGDEHERRAHLRELQRGQEDLGNALVRALASAGVLEEIRPGLFAGPRVDDIPGVSGVVRDAYTDDDPDD